MTLKISGGLGVSYKGRVDLAALPDALRSRARTMLSADKLSRLAAQPENALVADAVRYEIGFADADETFLIEEAQADADFLELIDELRPFLALLPQK